MSGQDVIYEMVNREILASLDRGVVPWRQPWKASGASVQRNGVTGHVYRGVNVFLLTALQHARGYGTPRWLTFRQARELGGTVRSGERGAFVVFWRLHKVTRRAADAERDEERVVPLLRYFNVFNVDQCDGLEVERLVPVDNAERGSFTPLEAAERIVQAYADGPPIVHGGDAAYWVPYADRIHLPRTVDFDSAESYYATLFHELAHSTGHMKRLDRESIRRMAHFGDALYGREELVAEMGSAFLQATAGIDGRLATSAAYLQNWMQAIRADRKLLTVAAAQAQKAADWVLGIRPTTTPVSTATGEDVSEASPA